MSDYDPIDNSIKCHDLAISEIRKRKVREGEYEPLQSRPEEVDLAPKPDDVERFA